ncbi:hypothetical protein FIU87_13280 [Bacillus sp. THAF10]|uniref:hypothetical protein n=1 Tax=Bacillus sp. THAF10 TaxID=2587848 RepID=UPI001267B787|nr:hypothetical protein [Bacillus sp. THAF10]QFT89627.1 hypothetical protein FIU87_13280 [Bacillus sp. THAF10]
MLSENYHDDQWKLLKQIKSTSYQKETIRTRILDSIQNSTSNTSSKSYFLWKSMLATCLLFVIFGGFLLLTLSESGQRNSSKETLSEEIQFSWDLKDVYNKESHNGLSLYREDNPMQVGTVQQVTNEEMNNIIKSIPMYTNEKLEHFPYQISMYIEHVKTMDVAIRYHFFISLSDQNTIHFTFDYPKLEYAEIFTAISTLKFNGKDPYRYNQQLYVTHGYGNLLFPVGLEPISISPGKEVYHWEGATFESFNAYLGKLEEDQGNWKKEATSKESDTFVSRDGNEVVTITRDEKTITYEFFYPNRGNQ